MRTGVLTTALLCLAATASFAQSGGEKLFDQTQHDFGTVARGAQLYHRFPWTNHAAVRREITEIRVSCGCVSATPLPRVLEPGQTGVVEVLVDAKRFVGPKSVQMHVVIGPDRPQQVTLQVAAHSRTDIVYNPGQVHFGVVAEGATPTQTIEIEYAGNLEWKILEVVNPSPVLEVASEEMYRMPGQAGYRLRVLLRAAVLAGDFKETIQLKTNDPANPVLPVLVEANVRPSILVVPHPVYFGTVKTGQAHTRQVTIRGDKPFQILKIDGSAKGLTTSTPSGTSAIHRLTVSWQPAEAGELNTELVIETNLERHAVLRVNVQGEAQ
jgi:hypothetical protein